MILDSFRLDDRVALVTGAARGLGQALAVGLAEAGADIVALDLLDLNETARLVTERGRRCHTLSRDLTGTTAVAAAEIVAASIGDLGRLDILVNNAGIIRRAPALDYPEADWEATVSVNLSTPFYLSQAAARRMAESGRGGKIINIVSMLAFQGGILVPAYTAAKSGLAGLTRALANEWAKQGINVNAISPGYLATDLTAALRDNPERSGQLLARVPVGRWGDPAELQGAAVFLASDAASYVHGAVLAVDGGWLAW